MVPKQGSGSPASSSSRSGSPTSSCPVCKPTVSLPPVSKAVVLKCFRLLVSSLPGGPTWTHRHATATTSSSSVSNVVQPFWVKLTTSSSSVSSESFNVEKPQPSSTSFSGWSAPFFLGELRPRRHYNQLLKLSHSNASFVLFDRSLVALRHSLPLITTSTAPSPSALEAFCIERFCHHLLFWLV